MRTYKIGDIAVALGVSVGSIRNWTAQEEFQEFLSDLAKREGNNTGTRQREYTQQDLYVLNTIVRQKSRFRSWDDVAEYLREGNLDTDLPPAAALIQTATLAENFSDAIMLRQQIDMLEKSLTDANGEIEVLRKRVDEVREEEQEKGRQREEKLRNDMIDLHRQIARLEYRIELAQEDDAETPDN